MLGVRARLAGSSRRAATQHQDPSRRASCGAHPPLLVGVIGKEAASILHERSQVARLAAGRRAHVENLLVLLRVACHDGQEGRGALARADRRMARHKGQCTLPPLRQRGLCRSMTEREAAMRRGQGSSAAQRGGARRSAAERRLQPRRPTRHPKQANAGPVSPPHRGAQTLAAS